MREKAYILGSIRYRRFDYKITNVFTVEHPAKPHSRPLFIIPRKNSEPFICILSRERQNAERGIIKQRNCLVWTIYWILSYGDRVVGYFRSPRYVILSQTCPSGASGVWIVPYVCDNLRSNRRVHFWQNRYWLLNCTSTEVYDDGLSEVRLAHRRRSIALSRDE